MKTSFLLCMVSFWVCIPAWTQSSRKLFLGINASADFCNRKAHNSSDNVAYEGILVSNMPNTVSKQKFRLGYTGGLNLKFDLNKYISIETGVSYSVKGFTVNSVNSTDPKMLMFIKQGDTIVFFGIAPENIHIQYQYKYLDIPLRVNITTFSSEEYRMYVTAGATFNKFLEQKTTTTTTSSIDSTKTVTKEYKDPFYNNTKLNVSPFVGLGLRYDLGKHLHLQMEMLYRGALLPVNDAPVKTYLWNAGINVGLYFRL